MPACTGICTFETQKCCYSYDSHRFILGVPLALIGMFLYSNTLIYAGLILYSAVAVFQLITLPVEFNASKRALETIESNHFLENEEYMGAKKY